MEFRNLGGASGMWGTLGDFLGVLLKGKRGCLTILTSLDQLLVTQCAQESMGFVICLGVCVRIYYMVVAKSYRSP